MTMGTATMPTASATRRIAEVIAITRANRKTIRAAAKIQAGIESRAQRSPDKMFMSIPFVQLPVEADVDQLVLGNVGAVKVLDAPLQAPFAQGGIGLLLQIDQSSLLGRFMAPEKHATDLDTPEIQLAVVHGLAAHALWVALVSLGIGDALQPLQQHRLFLDTLSLGPLDMKLRAIGQVEGETKPLLFLAHHGRSDLPVAVDAVNEERVGADLDEVVSHGSVLDGALDEFHTSHHEQVEQEAADDDTPGSGSDAPADDHHPAGDAEDDTQQEDDEKESSENLHVFVSL